MEKSQELINKIKKTDKISRYILIALLILNLIIVWSAVSYVLGRIDKFERTIDCKLLIIPEDRTKAKFIECSELNNDDFKEIINGKEKPSFKEVENDKKSSVFSPPVIRALSPIEVQSFPQKNFPQIAPDILEPSVKVEAREKSVDGNVQIFDQDVLEIKIR